MKETIDNILFDKYKRRIKKEISLVLSWQIILFVVFISSWQILSSTRIIDPLLFSSPSKVIVQIYTKMGDGSMIGHLSVTLFETSVGFLLGTILGIILASVLWSSKRIAIISDPSFVILSAMPHVALGPLIIVPLGPGYISIIMMGAVISVIIPPLVVYSAFNDVDPNYQKVLFSFG